VSQGRRTPPCGDSLPCLPAGWTSQEGRWAGTLSNVCSFRRMVEIHCHLDRIDLCDALSSRYLILTMLTMYIIMLRCSQPPATDPPILLSSSFLASPDCSSRLHKQATDLPRYRTMFSICRSTGSRLRMRVVVGWSAPAAPPPRLTFSSKPRRPAAATTRQAAATAQATPPATSGRQQFHQIPIDPRILQHIREQHVCKPTRQARSRKLDKLAGVSQKSFLVRGHVQVVAPPHRESRPPLPFGNQADPVRIRGSLHPLDPELSNVLDKINPARIPTVAFCGRSNVGE
jgi:hypothetical protein